MIASLTSLLGLAGALIYGSADFLGGIASRRISPIKVTAISAFSGLAVLLLAFPLVGGDWSLPAVSLGALSGVSGALAISLLYACLARGPMSVLSPITAVVSAIVPLGWGLLGGERLSLTGYAGLLLALIAVVLIAVVPEKGPARTEPVGIAMAVGSGVMIGIFLVIIDATPPESGLVPLILNRLVNGVLMTGAVATVAMYARSRRIAAAAGAGAGASAATASSSRWTLGRAARLGLQLALLCGAVDAAANTLLLLAIRIGELSVVSVLTAMYPAGTILLAAIVLGERITPVQIVGLVLALIAAGMLALA